MIQLVGNIDDALRYGRTQLGKPYDHQANTQARFGERKFDCSGFCSRCLWEGGMPRYHAGFGEGSASMAAWCEDHPEFRLSIDAAKNTRGALLVKGGTAGIGDAGHVVFSLGDGRTLESNGSRGVCIDDVDRLTWSHGLLAPVHYPHLEPEDDLDAVDKQLLRDLHAALPNVRDTNARVVALEAKVTQQAQLIQDLHNALKMQRAMAVKAGVTPT